MSQVETLFIIRATSATSRYIDATIQSIFPARAIPHIVQSKDEYYSGTTLTNKLTSLLWNSGFVCIVDAGMIATKFDREKILNLFDTNSVTYFPEIRSKWITSRIGLYCHSSINHFTDGLKPKILPPRKIIQYSDAIVWGFLSLEVEEMIEQIEIDYLNKQYPRKGLTANSPIFSPDIHWISVVSRTLTGSNNHTYDMSHLSMIDGSRCDLLEKIKKLSARYPVKSWAARRTLIGDVNTSSDNRILNNSGGDYEKYDLIMTDYYPSAIKHCHDDSKKDLTQNIITIALMFSTRRDIRWFFVQKTTLVCISYYAYQLHTKVLESHVEDSIQTMGVLSSWLLPHQILYGRKLKGNEILMDGAIKILAMCGMTYVPISIIILTCGVWGILSIRVMCSLSDSKPIRNLKYDASHKYILRNSDNYLRLTVVTVDEIVKYSLEVHDCDFIAVRDDIPVSQITKFKELSLNYRDSEMCGIILNLHRSLKYYDLIFVNGNYSLHRSKDTRSGMVYRIHIDDCKKMSRPLTEVPPNVLGFLIRKDRIVFVYSSTAIDYSLEDIFY